MTQAVLPTTLNPQLESQRLERESLCYLRVVCTECSKEYDLNEISALCSHRSPLLLLLPTKRRLTLAEDISGYRTAIAPNPFVLGP